MRRIQGAHVFSATHDERLSDYQQEVSLSGEIIQCKLSEHKFRKYFPVCFFNANQKQDLI